MSVYGYKKSYKIDKVSMDSSLSTLNNNKGCLRAAFVVDGFYPVF